MKSSICLLFFVFAVFADTFKEDIELWNSIDKLNVELEDRDEIPAFELEELFETAVSIAISNGFTEQIENLRTDAFMQDDFETIDQYIHRAAPALTIRNAGESCNTGINISLFLEKSPPGSQAYQFFDLALDGFYVNGIPGTVELPSWMEPGASSCQAVMNYELAELYSGIWLGFSPDFNGYFAEIADETIRCLGGEPDLSDEELDAYYQVYSNPFAMHVRKALTNHLNGSDEGLYTGSNLMEQLEMFREYLPNRFVVLSIDPAGMGGYSILLMSQEKPDRIFEAWVYALSNGNLELREFSESDQFTISDVAEIADRYRSFLADSEHSL